MCLVLCFNCDLPGNHRGKLSLSNKGYNFTLTQKYFQFILFNLSLSSSLSSPSFLPLTLPPILCLFCTSTRLIVSSGRVNWSFMTAITTVEMIWSESAARPVSLSSTQQNQQWCSLFVQIIQGDNCFQVGDAWKGSCLLKGNEKCWFTLYEGPERDWIIGFLKN